MKKSNNLLQIQKKIIKTFKQTLNKCGLLNLIKQNKKVIINNVLFINQINFIYTQNNCKIENNCIT